MVEKLETIPDDFTPAIIYSEEPQKFENLRYNAQNFAISPRPDMVLNFFDSKLLVPKTGITQNSYDKNRFVTMSGPNYQHPSRVSLKQYQHIQSRSEIGP